MRLIAAGCSGYKRFKDASEMEMRSRLICIVGPNAAGKSSFLDALVHLGRDEDFHSSERTRGADASTPTRVTARFELEAEDRARLATIPGCGGVRSARLTKQQGQARTMALEPAPQRDISHRPSVLSRLQALSRHEWLGERSTQESIQDVAPTTDRLVATAMELADSDDQDLDPAQLSEVALLHERLREADDLPHRFRGLPNVVHESNTRESARNPHDVAVETVWDRLPAVIKFEADARALRAAYDLLSDTPDVAIRNLLQLAGTTWDEAFTVVQANDAGQKTRWLDMTRTALANVVTSGWGQQDLTVRFHLDGSLLSVLMAMQDKDWIAIDQHSDGLRQFVALRAFLALRGMPVKPIVLIDEAETHLHYDAQADVVRVFEDQNEAAKVVYTTHSAGCLPRDLGVGIRAVVPITREQDGRHALTDHSHCQNRFWSHGSDFSPLLIAMGASAFAFSATQRAVVTEGISDAVLLPSLIREATQKEHLSYQVVPGFSEARPSDVAQFDLLAARVAFVADGDTGGSRHVSKLIANGVKREQIRYLGGRGKGLTLEDMVRQDVYLDAVNAELAARWTGVAITESDISTTVRAAALDALLQGRRDADGKTVDLRRLGVVERLLNLREASLVAPRRKAALVRLDKELEAVLAKATAHL